MTRTEDTLIRAEGPVGRENESAAPTGGGEAAGPTRGRASVTAADMGTRRHILRSALLVLTTLAFGVALDASVVSGLQHQSAQARAFAKLRYELAQGTAPVTQTGASTHPIPLGSPVALLEIPSLHIHEVVGEGTTSGVLMTGPGHRRDTPLPGQAGTSVIFGRAHAFGGPFKRLHSVRIGSRITVTTGQGISTFKVVDRRKAGDPTPAPPSSDQGRLQLVTATGLPYVPSGVLRVDADQASPTLASVPAGQNSLPKSEQPLSTDWGTAWALIFWLQALNIIAVGAVWSWFRWGRPQTWIVFLPIGTVAGLAAGGQFLRLLPNLL